MGDRGMDHSFLNPNQLRAHGVEVRYNPFEQVQCHINTGFDNIVILLFTQCTVIFTDASSPKEEELNNFQHITLTSSKIWDPHDIKFPKHTTIIEDNQFMVKTLNTS